MNKMGLEENWVEEQARLPGPIVNPHGAVKSTLIHAHYEWSQKRRESSKFQIALSDSLVYLCFK